MILTLVDLSSSSIIRYIIVLVHRWSRNNQQEGDLVMAKIISLEKQECELVQPQALDVWIDFFF